MTRNMKYFRSTFFKQCLKVVMICDLETKSNFLSFIVEHAFQSLDFVLIVDRRG